VLGYHWDADLVGRTEADARRELFRAMSDKFGIATPEDRVSEHSRSVPFPGLATVFISYRRTDNLDGSVTKLYHALSASLEHARIFLDVADPDPESDVRRRLWNAIDNAPSMLAVIGPNWVGVRPDATPRIFETEDFVRFEIEQALDSEDVSLVVVLLNGGQIGSVSELPEALRGLADVPSVSLDTDQFEKSVEEIVDLVLESAVQRHHIIGPPGNWKPRSTAETPFRSGAPDAT